MTHKLGIIFVLNLETELFFSVYKKNNKITSLYEDQINGFINYLNIFIINESRVAYDNFIHQYLVYSTFFYYTYLDKKNNLKSDFEF